MAATNQQVQNWSDQRTRPRCQALRNLSLQINDDIAAIGDVYANLTNNPTWTDDRTDGPPSLAQPSDLLSVNTVEHGFQQFVTGTFPDLATANSYAGQWAIILKLCVNPPV